MGALGPPLETFWDFLHPSRNIQDLFRGLYSFFQYVVQTLKQEYVATLCCFNKHFFVWGHGPENNHKKGAVYSSVAKNEWKMCEWLLAKKSVKLTHILLWCLSNFLKTTWSFFWKLSPYHSQKFLRREKYVLTHRFFQEAIGLLGICLKKSRK